MTNGNEPAFGHGFSNEYGDHEVPGLTKREYFAAMAMQGMLANPEIEDSFKTISSSAVDVADYIIEALNKQL
jgi:hypothetical protein